MPTTQSNTSHPPLAFPISLALPFQSSSLLLSAPHSLLCLFVCPARMEAHEGKNLCPFFFFLIIDVYVERDKWSRKNVECKGITSLSEWGAWNVGSGFPEPTKVRRWEGWAKASLVVPLRSPGPTLGVTGVPTFSATQTTSPCPPHEPRQLKHLEPQSPHGQPRRPRPWQVATGRAHVEVARVQ